MFITVSNTKYGHRKSIFKYAMCYNTDMTTAMLERRLAKLEAEVRQIRTTLPAPPPAKRWDVHSASFKKLPRGVQIGLRDVMAGRVSRPFDTVEELIADLES